jgi:hypothetical protein
LLFIVSALVAASHPGLFFNASDVPALRQTAQTTHASIAAHITTILNAHLNDPAPTPTEYDDYRFLGCQVAVWAFGYQLTGNTQYAAMARSELLTYASWSAWDNGETASLGGPDLAEAHMLMGNAIAYDWIQETLSAADRATIVAKLGAEAQKVAAYYPSAWWNPQYLQNHNWIDTAGLGMVGLVLQGEDSRAAGWLAIAQQNMVLLTQTIGQIPDGSWHEGLPYEGYGLAFATPFWAAMRHAGSNYLPDLGVLRSYGRWLLYAGLPDAPQQMVLPFGDFTHWPGWAIVQISRLAASTYRDGIAQAAADRYSKAISRGSTLPEVWYDLFEFINYDPSVVAIDPHTLPLDASFPDMGAATLHSSWNAGDFALGFKASVYGGHANFNRLKLLGSPAGGWMDWGHDHNDDMSFWLYGAGTWLAPEALGYDAGANASYAQKANFTNFHNVLMIDGIGQLGDARVSDSNWNNPWFFNRTSSTLVAPTGTADYAIAGGAGAGLYDASLGLSRWDRVVVLARSRYALVHDDIVASAPHAFSWICHFQDGVNVDTAGGWIQGVGKKSMSLGVRVLSPASWTATTGAQTAELMEQFDPDASTSYVQVTPSAKAATAQFLTALMPVATASWASRPAVNRLDATDTGAGAIVAPGTALEERWIFARNGSTGKTAGDLVLTGSQAGVAARNAAGSPIRSALFGPGSLSDQSGARLLLSSASAKAIEANLSGTTLQITGDSIADFHAYAPAATSILFNGAAASATFEAGMVTYPALPAAPAHLSAGPAALTFAAVQVGSAPPAQQVILLDDGGLGLTFTVTSDDAAVSVSSAQGSLAGGGSTSLTVRVAAQASAGSRTSHLLIAAGAAGTATIPLGIVFTAAPTAPATPGLLEVTPSTLAFEAVAGSAPATRSIIVSNSGGLPLTWTGSTADGDITLSTTSATLAAGAAQAVQITVDASESAGQRTASVVIAAGAAGTATVTAGITFTSPDAAGCGNCQASDAGTQPGTAADAGVAAPGAGGIDVTASSLGGSQGCSHGGTTSGWLLALGALGFLARKRLSAH